LTSKGLFSLLQAMPGPRDESLEQTFTLTPEFYALQVLFQKTEAPQESATLLNLICEGNWELLERFAKEQAQILDFSVDKRRSLLLGYVSLHSPTAAQLLLKTDFSFVLKRLEDKGILNLLSLLKKQTEEGTKFCVELLRSPRSDAIWQAAAMTLYAYAGEMPTLPIDPKAILTRFAPEISPPVISAKPAQAVIPSAARIHIVRDGENLWKISRQHKVKVDELVKLNHLENTALFPGMTLKLP
jgi:LysM repeat protein